MLIRRSIVRLAGTLFRGNSDLLTRIKNQEQGIYEPHVQEEIKLNWDKKYIKEVDTKTISLTGIITTPEVINLSEDRYSHWNELPLTK